MSQGVRFILVEVEINWCLLRHCQKDEEYGKGENHRKKSTQADDCTEKDTVAILRAENTWSARKESTTILTTYT